MIRDDITRMVGEACGGRQPDGWGVMLDHEQLERFVELVAAAEREACAKFIEDLDPSDHLAATIAAVIRARGQG